MSTHTRLSTLAINMVAALVVATPSAVYPSSAANQDRKPEIAQAEKQDQFLVAQENSIATPTPTARSGDSVGTSTAKVEKIAYAELLKKGFMPLHSEAPDGYFRGVYVRSADNGEEISSAQSGNDFEFLICVYNATYYQQSATMSWIVRNPRGVYSPFTYESQGVTLDPGDWCYFKGRLEIPYNTTGGNWSFQGILHASSTTNGGSSVKTVNVTSVSTSPPTPAPTPMPAVVMNEVYLAGNREGQGRANTVQAGTAYYPVINWTNRANVKISASWNFSIYFNGYVVSSESGIQDAEPGNRLWRMQTFNKSDMVMSTASPLGTYTFIGKICGDVPRISPSEYCQSSTTTFSVVAPAQNPPASTPRPPTPRPPTPRPPITGYVRSNDGVPLPGIKVVAGYDYQRESDDPFKHQNEPQQIAVAYTNAAGEFRLENPWNETGSFGNGFVRKGFIQIEQEPKDCGLTFPTKWIWDKNASKFDFKATVNMGTPRNKTIVFVHGWTGNPMTAFGDFPQIFREKGYFVFCAPLETSIRLPQLYTPEIHINARRLQTRLSEYLVYTGNDKATLIAHSMGGIVSRRYIEDNNNNDGDGIAYANNVDRLFTFGSPHLGIRALGQNQLAQYALNILNQKVWVNFMKPEAQRFNESYRQNENVTYFFIGGNQDTLSKYYCYVEASFDYIATDLSEFSTEQCLNKFHNDLAVRLE